MSEARPPYYCWFDLEFTDLDPDKAALLQVALLITDVDLQPLEPEAKGLNIIVRLPEEASVSSWVQENLASLLIRCRSPEALSVHGIEDALLTHTEQWTGPKADDIKERPVLAGNSVHADWRLAARHFPRFIDRLHYRLLDVSTVKQQWHDWAGKEEFDKENASLIREYLPFTVSDLGGQPHDAFYDILASIAELNFYRQKLLRR